MEYNTSLCYGLFLCSVLIQLCFSHLCLITPRQRGDMDISKGGSHTCFRHGAPCGGIPPDFPPKITLEAGRPVFIKWQQNFNHYTVGYPGYMDIAIAVANDVANMDHVTDAPDPFRKLAVVADKDEYDQAHQRNYTAVVTLPDMPCDHCVIRARYVAHKPGETTFYQCADVNIKAVATVQPLPQKSLKYPNLLLPGPVMLAKSQKPENGEMKETSLISILSKDEISTSDSEERQIKAEKMSSGEENIQKAINFTYSKNLNSPCKNCEAPELLHVERMKTSTQESEEDSREKRQGPWNEIPSFPHSLDRLRVFSSREMASDSREGDSKMELTNKPDPNVSMNEMGTITNPKDQQLFSTPESESFLAQNHLHASTKSLARVYGMTNNIDYPENADLVSFDTVSGIRYDVAPLTFRVDSPLFQTNGVRQRLLNSSLDYVTDGVLTLDTGRGVTVMPLNRHNNMDATADSFIEIDTKSGTVKSVYDVISGKNKSMPLRSAFSAIIVEIESSYVTFNIEPDEEEDGKFNFVVGRLHAGGSWVMLSKTDQPEDLYINFMWADYDISVKTLYVLLGNENDPLGLSARLYKFFVMPGPSSVQYSRASSSYVTLDVSRYPFMAFHLHPLHSNLLYAVSPGLHNATTPSYHLVVVDVDMGTVKEEMQITPPGVFERFYGGAVRNGLNSYPPQLLHVLRVANTEADVIVTLDLTKKVASFSQVTNIRNVYSLHALF